MLRRRQKKSRLRRLADSTALDTFILVAIGFNCVVMAFPPKVVSRADSPSDFFCIADFVLNLVFLLEFLIKFGAYGFAYFNITWNILDFVVVVQGCIAILSQCPVNNNRFSLPLGDISALRMIRILRPLKSLRKFPEMRLLVTSLFGSFNLLLAIIALTIMAVFVMGVFASLYFGDSLDYRCLPDPYYDPFSGQFAGNPRVYGENRFNLSIPTYWASRASYREYEDLVRDDRHARRRQFRYLASNFWKSTSMYRDYQRDEVPQSRTFPYLSSFCGGCKSCRRCEACYSDDPTDGCLPINPTFFRRYGYPKSVVDDFHGEIPGTIIVNIEGNVSVPISPTQLRGVPLSHQASPRSILEPLVKQPNVTYIREYCVDTKRGATAEYIDIDSPALNESQYAALVSPRANFLDIGFQVLTRFSSRLDLTDPSNKIEKLLFQLKNCEVDRNKARDALAELQEINPVRFPPEDRLNKKTCRKDYAGKTGERRHGVFGKPRPRKRRYLWYHQFDATLWSLLAIFDIMNMEGWNDAMWSIQMSVGKYTWPVFYAVIGVVNICLLNLFPAVMSFNLRKEIRKEENKNALEAKAAFMGTDLLSMTQFEEHMIDILAAEEEETLRVRAFLAKQGVVYSEGTDVNDVGGPEYDPLEGVRCVPQGAFFESLRNLVMDESGPFNIFIYTCIFLNIVAMSQTRLHVNNKRDRRINAAFDLANTIFVVIFATEIVIKNMALGPFGYFRDNYNKFDFVLGILGIIDLFAAAFGSGQVLGLLRIVRVTRVIRVFRLASISKIRPSKSPSGDLDFLRLMSVISLSATWIMNILGLLFLTLYTAAIISMQVFANEVYMLNDYSGQWKDKGRLNFDTFPMAFITSFIVLSGDDWNTIMYSTMSKAGSVACLFFIILIVIGRYAILSMLTAIIFDEVERESISVIKQSVRTTMLSVFKFEHALMNCVYRFHFFKWYAYIRSRKVGDQEDKPSALGQVTLMALPPPPLTRWQRFMRNSDSYLIFPDPDRLPNSEEDYEEEEDPKTKTPKPSRLKYALARVRKLARVVGRSAIFANIIFVTIMVSIILLALFYQISNSSEGKSFQEAQKQERQMRQTQRACVAIFVTEFVILTVADTVTGYLSHPMNALDASITALSFAAIWLDELAPFAIIRVIRIIRPLKKLARSSPSVMSILSALESSAKGVAAVGFLAVTMWLTIAVCGIQLFQGKLNYCSASRYPEGGLLKAYRPDRNRFRRSSRKYKDWPEEQFTYINSRFDMEVAFPPFRAANNSRGCKVFYPLVYEQYNRNDNIVDAMGTFRIMKSEYNFDNLYEAFRSAFLVFSFDDWHKLVLSVMNAKTTGAYLNHEAEASTALPAIFFFLSGCTSFLINTLFVGVIYGTFTYRMLVTNHEHRRLASLKDIQWRVYELKLSCIKALQEPQNPNSTNVLMRNLYAIFRHRSYKVVYALLILTDVIGWWLYVGTRVALAPRDQQHREIRRKDQSRVLRALRTADHVFCCVLIAECVLKLSTFGWFTMLALVTEQVRVILHIPIAIFLSLEFSNSWNKLRALDIQRGCDGSSDENDPQTCDGGALQRFIYGLRTTQVFLVIPAFVELKTIVYALYAALGTTLPMLVLMISSTFAFAVVGMMFLGTEDLEKRDDGEPVLFGAHWFATRLKFTSINKSMNTLFLAATANDWIQIKDTFERMVENVRKVPNVIFWLLHVLIFRYLFLNVCTMIFIYKYESTSPVQPWIAMEQVEEFLRAWQQFDEFGVGRIRTKYLSRLLRLLSPPLGMTRDAPQLLADRHAKRILMAIPFLLESEIFKGKADLDVRWKEIEESFVGSHTPGQQHAETHGESHGVKPVSQLPRYLEFGDVIKAVHRVVIFSDLQALPDDDEFTEKREFAQAKLDILRLAIHRFSNQHVRVAGASSLTRAEPTVQDMSLMQRLSPDVFRYRMRQALTLETHRWQRQIELSKFDEESFHECELLLAIVREEKLAAEMQLHVLNALAAKGSLNAFQERRPKLHRHIAFLNILQQRLNNERSKHVRKAWLASSVVHSGTLPVAPKGVLLKAERQKQKNARHNHKNLPGERVVSSVAANEAGDTIVSAHAGNTITIWKKRKEKKVDLLDSLHAARGIKAEDSKEAPVDPWNTSPFYKAQVIEDSARVVAVAMTREGRRFFVTSANNIKSYVRGKKLRGQRGIRFNCESIMTGHAAPVNALQVANRYLFSTSDDGSIKMWRLRSNDAQQTANITYSNRCLSLCVINTTRLGQEDDHNGLHALVGLDNGKLSVLPYSLHSQWLQGAVWRPKLSFDVFEDDPITACSWAYRHVYCGGATGDIAVLRAVRGDEDLATLEATAEEMKREGFQLKDLNNLTGSGSRALRARSESAASLSQIVRLEHLYRLSCHTQAITGFCLAGGLFFTSSRDLSIVSWQRPMDVTTHAIHVATKTNAITDEQSYLTARVTHKAAITAIAVAGDYLATSDEDGSILLHKAERYREVVESAPSTKLSRQQLEIEVIEKPAFFALIDLSKVKPRHFLAQILAHYYPIKLLNKPSKPAGPSRADPDEDSRVSPRDAAKQSYDVDDPDDENLDDDFYDVGGGEDEYGEFDEDFDEEFAEDEPDEEPYEDEEVEEDYEEYNDADEYLEDEDDDEDDEEDDAEDEDDFDEEEDDEVKDERGDFD
mmetsp:Transcript_22111/g.69161  ORF Transcript_22111/g.69161 Transcript_22111/m.69161 type:complete len:2656 (-) Transcript_22111:428-8395(-)